MQYEFLSATGWYKGQADEGFVVRMLSKGLVESDLQTSAIHLSDWQVRENHTRAPAPFSESVFVPRLRLCVASRCA